MRSRTEFESWGLLVYCVRTWLTGADSFRLKLLAIPLKKYI